MNMVKRCRKNTHLLSTDKMQIKTQVISSTDNIKRPNHSLSSEQQAGDNVQPLEARSADGSWLASSAAACLHTQDPLFES